MERVSQRKNIYFYLFYPSELILLDVIFSTGVVFCVEFCAHCEGSGSGCGANNRTQLCKV